MENRCFYQIVVSVVAVVLLMSTARAQGATQAAPAPVEASRKVPANPAWQVKWDELVREARKEGVLSVYASTIGPEEKVVLQRGMKEKFGIALDVLIAPQAAFVTKLNLERRAGIFSTDVWVSGPSALVSVMRPQGLIDPLDDVLILPEVVDKKSWISKDGVFFDKERKIIGGFATPSLMIFVNKKLVSHGEIKGWADLLNPKWKGKMSLVDGSIPGTASTIAVSMILIMGEDYMRKLARQEPALTRSTREHIEWVVRGKFAIGIGGSSSTLKRFTDAGAGDLVEEISPVEGAAAGTGGHSMALINRAPHPNAAKLFLNWTQTREIQTLMARHSGNASRRVDVSNDWLKGARVVQPGMKIIELTEEIEGKYSEYAKIFAEIFLAPKK